MIAKELFKSLTLPAVSLDDAVIDPWMQATRYGRVDFVEVCCTSESLLCGAVTSLGGRAVQYSHWNGFDLSTKAGTDKLKEDLVEKKPRVVLTTPPCTTQRHNNLNQAKFHRIQMNNLVVFSGLRSRLVRDDSEQMWGSTSLDRGGAFSELKEQYHSGRTPVCQWVNSLMERFLQNPGTSSVDRYTCRTPHFHMYSHCTDHTAQMTCAHWLRSWKAQDELCAGKKHSFIHASCLARDTEHFLTFSFLYLSYVIVVLFSEPRPVVHTSIYPL